MSYTYVATATGATSVAADMATRINNITGTPNLSAPVVNPDYQAFLRAQADSLLLSVGYQGQDDVAGTSDNQFGATFVNCFTPWTTPTLLAKNYLVDVDVAFFFTVAIDTVFFQLLVDGVAPSGQPANAAQFLVPALSTLYRIRIPIPVLFTAGTHVLQLQFKTTGVGRVRTDSTCNRTFTLVG